MIKIRHQKLHSSLGYVHQPSRLFIEVVIKSWWVIVFFLICFFIYDRSWQELNMEKIDLHSTLLELIEEKKQAVELQEELKLKIYSQKDPAWIEMTLLKGLGLVPEGQTKVYFQKQEQVFK